MSASVTIPMRLPLASITGSPLIRFWSSNCAASCALASGLIVMTLRVIMSLAIICTLLWARVNEQQSNIADCIHIIPYRGMGNAYFCYLDMREFLRVHYVTNSLDALCLHFNSQHSKGSISDARN